MARPDARWGSDRSRLRVVAAVLFAVLLLSMALAWALVWSRPRPGLLGWSSGIGPRDSPAASGASGSVDSPMMNVASI